MLGHHLTPKCRLRADAGRRLSRCLAATGAMQGKTLAVPQTMPMARQEEPREVTSCQSYSQLSNWWVDSTQESAPAQPRASLRFSDDVRQGRLTDGSDSTWKQRCPGLHLNTSAVRAQGRWSLFWKAEKPN